MNELEKNIPDDFWRKAFDEAAETPPPRVWDVIERRLDSSDSTKILPLWGAGLASSGSIMWGAGMAAAVALLLVGWWTMHTVATGNDSRPIAHHAPPATALSAEKSITVAGNTAVVNSQRKPSEAVASVAKRAPLSEKPSSEIERPQLAPFNNYTIDNEVAQLIPKRNMSTLQSLPMPVSQLSQARTAAGIPSVTTSRMAVASFVSSDVIPSPAVPMNPSGFIQFESLSGQSLRVREFGQIQRIVWFRPAEPEAKPESTQSKRKAHEVWASASVMPSSFNPMVTIKSSSVAMANTASFDALKNTSTSQSPVTSRANFSVAYQASAGVQLTEHWSIESGVGYLAGRSTVETPTQLVAYSQLLATPTTNAITNTLYVDALRNSIHRSDLASAAPQASYNNLGYASTPANYSSQSNQVLTNDFQYMQVPVQVGYQLRPKKRLSLALLGGLITNIFIRNTVDNQVEITAKDGVYKPVSLAASLGARFRYRPTRQWSASLAGIYQPALGLGTQADSQVQSRPTTAGMSLGVDYHF